MKIYTIGHSTRPIADFISLLKQNHITTLVDVRSIPHSKFNPQYNKNQLSDSLKASGITYIHIPGLGGFRTPAPNSVNTAWINKRFQAYADYMQTKLFQKNLSLLITLAKPPSQTIAIMCSEAVPWRCHRSLISDALTIRNIKVYDIISINKPSKHNLTSFAVVKNKKITYPYTN